MSSSVSSPSTWRGRILLIDAYDSYIYNIHAFVKSLLPHADILLVPYDRLDPTTLRSLCDTADACILGPGPGNPACSKDIGCFPSIWSLPAPYLPTLGICLGMQTLGHHFGARLYKLALPAHGIRSKIRHTCCDLFEGLPSFQAVRYHSFAVDINGAADLQPLAWTDDAHGTVLMAIRHLQKPFFGLQYHPESIYSTYSRETLHNFWQRACAYNAVHRSQLAAAQAAFEWSLGLRTTLGLSATSWPDASAARTAEACVDPSTQRNDTSASTRLSPCGTGSSSAETDAYTTLHVLPSTPPKSCASAFACAAPSAAMQRMPATGCHVTLPLRLSTPALVEALSLHQRPHLALLDSVTQGRWTLIGVPSDGHYALTYAFPDAYAVKASARGTEQIPLDGSIWTWLRQELQRWQQRPCASPAPFKGGFMGYVSYESGVCTADIQRLHRQRPDVHLLFFERSVAVDVLGGVVVVQSLVDGDEAWVHETARVLRAAAAEQRENSGVAETRGGCEGVRVVVPDKEKYLAKIRAAQTHLMNGEAYQLCLTATTRVFVSTPCTPQNDWELYKRLRMLNPAPFGGYLRFDTVTLLSSSPERFLNWSHDGLCEMRPIKGTVAKTPSMNLENAEKILQDPKYVAENLMILDLIRNDLYRITKNVQVPATMQVETYKTLYQLVSVVQGRFNPPLMGVDVLAHTLPPGSMTGAPKKRSVELLHQLEDNERDIFSGVFGYLSVCGTGDWSVIIRSTFRHHDEDHWNIGAGGAVTILLDPEEEWDEMILKLQSVLPLFTMDIKTI